MLEKHDKSKFEVFGFYLGRSIDSEDLWHDRIKKTFDKFFDVSSMTEFEISELSIFFIFPLNAIELKYFGLISFSKIIDSLFEKTPSDTIK